MPDQSNPQLSVKFVPRRAVWWDVEDVRRHWWSLRRKSTMVFHVEGEDDRA